MVASSRVCGSGGGALLAAATRAFLEGEPLPEHVVLDADWDQILTRAQAEGVAPLIYAVSRAVPLPVAVRDRLRAAWLAFQRQHLLGLEQLRGVLAAFERADVPVIPLKGPLLAERLYPDPALRPFTDLDLLIAPSDLSRALELLSTLGYRHLDEGRPLGYELAYAAAAAFVRDGASPRELPLDVHWKLLDHRSGRRARAIEFGEIWDRAVKVVWWGQPGLTLCPEDLVIYLALHWAVHHAFSGLVWRLDLALLLRRYGGTLDWEGVAERARRWGVRRALHAALSEVQAGFGVGPPPGFLGRLRPRGPRVALLEWLRRRSDEERERLDYLVPVLLMDRGLDLLWLLAWAALPPGKWVRSRYGRTSLLGAYRAHFGRIGRVCWRTVRASLGRPA